MDLIPYIYKRQKFLLYSLIIDIKNGVINHELVYKK